MGGKSSYHKIWNMVCRIPRGYVSTYGEIARRCGLNGQARLVGYALHNLPDGIDVPWQRVVNAKGMISFPQGSSSHMRQKRLLEAERIRFEDERIDLKRYGWARIRDRRTA